jgi:hypothetical protein
LVRSMRAAETLFNMGFQAHMNEEEEKEEDTDC